MVVITIAATTTLAQGQSSQWYGAPYAPFWNKEPQGSKIIHGTVVCDASGETFLVSNAKYRQSLIIRNRGTQEVFVCPASSTLCGSMEGARDNGFNLLENEALVLDKSNNAAGSTGWVCYTIESNSDVRFLAEEGY